MSIISENLKTLRTTAGYSQKDIAEMSGAAQPTINCIEQGADPNCKVLR